MIRLKYVISDENINIILYFLKLFFINIGSYYIFLRLINKRKFEIKDVIALLITILITSICTIVKQNTNSINCMILSILLLSLVFSIATRKTIGYSTDRKSVV